WTICALRWIHEEEAGDWTGLTFPGPRMNSGWPEEAGYVIPGTGAGAAWDRGPAPRAPYAARQNTIKDAGARAGITPLFYHASGPLFLGHDRLDSKPRSQSSQGGEYLGARGRGPGLEVSPRTQRETHRDRGARGSGEVGATAEVGEGILTRGRFARRLSPARSDRGDEERQRSSRHGVAQVVRPVRERIDPSPGHRHAQPSLSPRRTRLFGVRGTARRALPA